MMHKIQILTKRHTMQMPHNHTSAQIGFPIQEVKDRRTSDKHLQSRMGIVYLLNLAAPPLVFMDLIDIQMISSFLDKLVRQLNQSVEREITMISRDIETMLFRCFNYMLFYHCAFTHPSSAG